MNLSTVKWAQWDKIQSRELLVCSYVCALHCAQLLHTILHRTDLIVAPLTLQTITSAPMMSIWGKGGGSKSLEYVLEVCPTYTDRSISMTTPLDDSGINDRLVKLRPLIDQTCFEFIDVRYFGAVNNKIPKNIYQIFNPTNVLNHVAPLNWWCNCEQSNLFIYLFIYYESRTKVHIKNKNKNYAYDTHK